MNRLSRRLLVVMLVFQMILLSAVTVSADAVTDGADEDYTPFVAFGADLTNDQKATVMGLLGVTKDDLSGYKTIEITNKQEHEYLGDYLSDSIIGKRALSSVLVVKQEEGTGIGVDTHNINYCTAGMYCNALITAGITDAEVVVAGPFDITGTAALVGAMKAYSVMTGEEITQESMDAATNELVLTGEIAESTGDAQKTEQLIAAVKKAVIEEKLAKPADIREAVVKSAGALDVEISDADVDKIVDLMDKINGLDLDVDAIKEQAKDVYDKLSAVDFDFDFDKKGLIAKVGDFFAGIFSAIGDFFKGLFS